RLDDYVDDPVGQHGRGESEADAERLPFDGDAARRAADAVRIARILQHRHGEFAAGEEVRGFARQSDQGRFGQGGDRAPALESVERRVEVLAEGAELLGDDAEAADNRAEGGRAVAHQGGAAADRTLQGAAIVADKKSEADILERRALDLGETHFKHPLLRGAHRHQVYYL